MDNRFTFEISLSVLNHLGRNLYRNIITVIGEAISNSWDADASNVWIHIDRDNNYMSIKDDGIGMNQEDFQDKFLRIGYSKRKTGQTKSEKGRPYIGRKGIGKLALLSCAKKVTVISHKKDCEIIGGTIDNSELDKAITEDVSSYTLQPIAFEKALGDETGTIVTFEDITNGFFYTTEYMKVALALYFSFSIVDESFNIYLNDELINEKMLKDLADNTQFCWTINGFNSPYVNNQLKCEKSNLEIDGDITGFVASVNKPSQLKKRGTQEKATIDLFVNGRLREKDILRHIPTSRIVENYVYGQIHCDNLDSGEGKDLFTSSREGVKADEPEFRKVIDEFEKSFRIIIDEWDTMRRKKGDDGDPENQSITKRSRKAEELFNQTVKELKEKNLHIEKDSVVDQWIKNLSVEAQFNVPSYTECFIAENMLRQYIVYTQQELSSEAIQEANKWRSREADNKGKANISFRIRESDDDIYYLDMDHLANFVDKPKDRQKEAGISRSATVYKPIRDAVGHTSVLTDLAKNRLTIEFENIKERLIQVLNNVKDNKK